jgi:hypothetical protein
VTAPTRPAVPHQGTPQEPPAGEPEGGAAAGNPSTGKPEDGRPAAGTRAAGEPADTAAGKPAVAGPDRAQSRRFDALVLLVCLAAAGYLTGHLWRSPTHRVVTHNRGDQALFEWLLGYAAHSVSHLDNPLWTNLLNVPMGVNLAVNTSMVVVGAVVAPITLLLGAPVAFLVVLTANLAFTPFAWYWLLSRHLVRTRTAAVLGALFCGFAPGVVSHANAHLNFTGQFLVPLIGWCVLRLGRGGPPVRTGLLLGVLVVLDFSIGAEMLFFVALALALFLAVWAAQRRAAARAAARGLLTGVGVAGLVALVGLAYPLYLQFFGPQRYHGIGFDQRVHSEDLLSFVSFPFLSPARWLGLWHQIAPNYTEETTFFGPALLVLAVVCAVALWRRPEVRALSVTALVFGVLSLGPLLHVDRRNTGIPLPWTLLGPLPIFNSALPARLDLILIPIIGLLLAFAVDRLRATPPALSARARRAWLAGFVVALLPIVPLPIPGTPRADIPRFFTDGTWRQYVHSGQTLVPVPPPSDLLPDGQRWQTAAHFGFAIPAGFFLGPGGPDGHSRIGPVPRPTYDLLTAAALWGVHREVTAADRAQAKVDLAYWRATVIVLANPGPADRWIGNAALVRAMATELFGPPVRVDDVWLWQVG